MQAAYLLQSFYDTKLAKTCTLSSLNYNYSILEVEFKAVSVQYLKEAPQNTTNFVMNSIQMLTQNRSISWNLDVSSNYLNICVSSE